MPPPQVGPPLHNVLRGVLEGKQIQNSTIKDFLARNPSLKRYGSSFNLLWKILVTLGVHPPSASVDQVADALVQLFQFWKKSGQKCLLSNAPHSWVWGAQVAPPFDPLQKSLEHQRGKVLPFLGPPSHLEEAGLRAPLCLSTKYLCNYVVVPFSVFAFWISIGQVILPI